MSGLPHGGHRLVIVVWLAFAVCCGWLASRASFTADLSAFLPSAPTAEQRLLVDLLKDGVASRLILVGIEGADAATRAGLSKALAERLRAEPAFSAVNNGESAGLVRDREFLFTNRYRLSPAVTAEHFSVAGLHAALAETINGLSSSAGLLLKALLPRDPTGEMTRLLDLADGGTRPASIDGVWAARDGQRALLLLRTQAAGADIDGQQQAVAAVRRAFDAVAGEGAAVRLLMTGPGVFAVAARDTIRGEAIRLSTLGSLIIVALLLLLYRSLATLLFGLLPVVSGALAGVAAVSLVFGVVHGVTVGFGATLIGEAVDYSIYLFVQSDGQANRAWLVRFWPTVRLGMLTSVFGFASLLFSGFPGLAQLGLYSIAGLLTAAAVSRFVLPALRPGGFAVRDVSSLGLRLAVLSRQAWRLRGLLAVLLLAAGLVLTLHRDAVWNHELAALSPVPAADLALDAAMRADLGAPDVRYLVVVPGADREAALRSAEQLGEKLQALTAAGVIAGFETPARFLPSAATQQARLAALPSAQELAARLGAAVLGLPVQAGRFAPFAADVEAARRRGVLTRADLEGTTLALAVDGMLVRHDQAWMALLPLKAPLAGPSAQLIQAAAVREALAAAGPPGVLFVDIKSETDRLYAGYLQEAIHLSLAGLAAILVLLLAVLRSPARVARVSAPLLAAVLVVVGGLVLAGQRLILLHLVGLLLIVAVGSNYALFFDRRGGDSHGGVAPRTLASLLFANIATAAGFGLLAFSSVPVLQAIGATVAPGAFLALVFSAILAERPKPWTP